MPAREPQPRRQIGVPGEGDSRWDAVWQLVLRAEQLPAGERSAFMQSAETDPFIIRQAVAILEGSESLATAAASLPLATEERFIPQIGMKIGRYRVGTLLGSGGAGSVYAAFDEELNRPVAIKFVSSRRSGSSDAPALPLREARAASALDHPNIIMIHEVIETGDTDAIVMELVRGVTLRAAAQKTPSLGAVLHWSTQLAQALAVAHSHGLIHGDIKPENVMVRDDGYIKLLDFGLALDVQPRETRGPRLAGTLRYLAPERCLGQPPTQAGDVFAFGVILYELTTGRHPYESENTLALLQAITEKEAPRPATFRPDLPAAIDHLIRAMLARPAEERPTAQQVADRLTEAAHPTPRRPMTVWLAFAAIALVALLAAAYWFRNPPRSGDFSRMTVRPLASQPGLEDNPSISPDGLWVSCLYRVHAADRPKLQVHSLQGVPPVEIETGGLVVQGAAAWSPDSTELAFAAVEGPRDHAIYRVRRAGGVPTRIAVCKSRTNEPCEVDWSPDGTTLAVTDRRQDNSELYLVNLANGGRRELVTPLKESVIRPRFSPDGKWIAYLKRASLMSDDLYVVAVAGGPPRHITRTPSVPRGFVWSADGKRLLAIVARPRQKFQMWQFPLDGGEPYSAGELDLTRGTQPTLSRGTGSLAWVRDLSANSIWPMPVDQSRLLPEPLTNSAAVDIDPEWSSNGRMVFRSDRSGVYELWIANADGSRPWQATRFRGPFVGDPHWSPDGRAIAFSSHADGNPDIYVMQCEQGAATCSEPRQLTKMPASDANPTWSADGRWIYFSSSRSGSHSAEYEVWRMPADGGVPPERVTWNGGYMARESADGKWLYYSKHIFPTTAFWRIALPARGPGQPETLVAPNVPYKAAATWALGARELFYYPAVEDPAVRFPPVRAVNLETGRTRDLPVGNIRLARGLSLSPDERWLVRSQIDRALTLVMIAE
jgi:Tol biopolymer transport system component/serine/threonine protein kinase